MNAHLCNDGLIKVPAFGTNGPINHMTVNPMTMRNVRKPSNLPDYHSLCYGISDDDFEDSIESKMNGKIHAITASSMMKPGFSWQFTINFILFTVHDRGVRQS